MPGRSLWPNLQELDRRLTEAGDIGLLTDADGTLSEIQNEPGLASVDQAVSTALGRLNELYGLVAVVSGRRAREVQALVGQPDLLYLGNHGLEERRGRVTRLAAAARQSADAVSLARAELKRELPRAEGLYLEDKKSVLAVHYRRCGDRAAVLAAVKLAGASAKKHGLRLQHGRRITEIRPPGADKGEAVVKLVRRHGLKQVIYLGDDATDIDAFDALKKAAGRGFIDSSVALAVAGGESPAELKGKADYWVSSVAEVARFLGWLIERAERGGKP